MVQVVIQYVDADNWAAVMSIDTPELFRQLRAYRVSADHRGDATKNEFWALSEQDVQAAEERMGFRIPNQLREFYTEVGCGHLVTSSDGLFQNDYFNIFVDLQRLVDFWLRTEVSFQYDPEIVAEGELPFFDMGSYSYFVFRPSSDKPNAVYSPYDRKPISESFNEFVSSLFENTTFYLAHEGDYGT